VGTPAAGTDRETLQNSNTWDHVVQMQ